MFAAIVACVACGSLAVAPKEVGGALAAASNARQDVRGSRVVRPLSARLRIGGYGQAIPFGFFGLSVEYSEIAAYEREGRLLRRVLSLLRSRSGGPMLLRVGGSSADHVWWQASSGPLPRGVFRVDRSWLAGLAGLVRGADLRVLLDLNLAVHSPALEAGFVLAAERALPPSTVAGVEVGNEPNLYWHEPWLDRQGVRATERGVGRVWTRAYTAASYRRDYRAYARALLGAVPGLSLGAPDVTYGDLPWLGAVTGLGRFSPAFLAIHRYASSSCWPAGSPNVPTVGLLLADGSSTGLANSLLPAEALAHTNRMALRVTELNSISCGGNAGVADSFATALWAPDTLFEMVRRGVNGVNWHIRPTRLNAPFLLAARGIKPLPELYGLAVFAQMTSGHATLVHSTLSASPGLHLKAWVVRSGPAIRILLINKGARTATVMVPATTTRTAVLRRLQAPSIRAEANVRYAGRWIGRDGRWHGRQITTRTHAISGIYHVLIPAWSAVSVTVGA